MNSSRSIPPKRFQLEGGELIIESELYNNRKLYIQPIEQWQVVTNGDGSISVGRWIESISAWQLFTTVVIYYKLSMNVKVWQYEVIYRDGNPLNNQFSNIQLINRKEDIERRLLYSKIVVNSRGSSHQSLTIFKWGYQTHTGKLESRIRIQKQWNSESKHEHVKRQWNTKIMVYLGFNYICTRIQNKPNKWVEDEISTSKVLVLPVATDEQIEEMKAKIEEEKEMEKKLPLMFQLEVLLASKSGHR